MHDENVCFVFDRHSGRISFKKLKQIQRTQKKKGRKNTILEDNEKNVQARLNPIQYCYAMIAHRRDKQTKTREQFIEGNTTEIKCPIRIASNASRNDAEQQMWSYYSDASSSLK
jgi:hypothetical protein